MLGYSLKSIPAPGFACVMSSYLSQREKVVLAYVRTDFPLSTVFFCISNKLKWETLTYVRTWPSFSWCYVFLLFARWEKGVCLYLARAQSCLSTYCMLKKGVVCNICLYLAFPVMSFYFLQGDTRGFHHMFVPGFPCVMSFYSSQSEKGGGFNICPYLAFPVSCLPTYRKVNKGADLTCVHSWYFLCRVFLLTAT